MYLKFLLVFYLEFLKNLILNYFSLQNLWVYVEFFKNLMEENNDESEVAKDFYKDSSIGATKSTMLMSLASHQE